MDNNTPVAPTDAPAPASVATPTNSNEQTQAPAPAPAEAPQTPAEPTAEQIAKYLGTTPESLEKAKKFYENNGGFDKVFGERKQEITTPKSQQPQVPAEPQQPTSQVGGQVGGQVPPTNNLSQEYLEATAVKNYFRDLAEKPEYANIAAQLKDGTVMEEASKRFGISPIANGRINEAQITEFCNMYSKTMPAAPASTPMTNIPTAQATGEQFTGNVSSMADAMAVIKENSERMAAGLGEHAKLKDAQAFLQNGFNERHPKQSTFQPWQPKQ